MKKPELNTTQVFNMVRVEQQRPTQTPARDAANVYALDARFREQRGRDLPLILHTLSHEFAGQLPALLEKDFELLDGTHAHFQTIIDKHLTAIHEAPNNVQEISRAQQEFVRELVRTLSLLPVKNWNISPRQLVENGGANCSTAAASLQMMIESTARTSGIPTIDYANPPGHAFNMVRFPDGTIFYADPRNGVFENVTHDVVVSRKPGLTIYKLLKPNERMPFRYVTALEKASDGMVAAYLANISEIPDVAAGNFPAAFTNATEQEREQMQREAAQLTGRPEIAPDAIAHTRTTYHQLYEPLNNFFDEPAITEEIAHFEPATQPDEAKVKIGQIIQSNGELRVELRQRRAELRAFLLGDEHTFETSDQALTRLLNDYRTGRAKTWTLLHRTRTEREQEVDAALAQL